MLEINLYETMMEEDEMWYIYAPGCAFLIWDLPICDA